MVKFRCVILDDYDNVIEVLDESPEYKDEWDRDWIDYEYHIYLLFCVYCKFSI